MAVSDGLPSFTPSDLNLIHRLWLDAIKAVGPHVHHHDVVRAALTQMEQQLKAPARPGARRDSRDAHGRPTSSRRRARTATSRGCATWCATAHAGDLARTPHRARLEDQVVVFRVLPRKDAAAVFEYLSLEAQEALLKAMAQEDVAALLNNMAPDDRTMFLEELPAAATRQLLTLLTPAERAVAVDPARLSRGSVGRLMTPHYVAVREHWTVSEVLDYIRTHGQDSETLNVIYVVDEHGAAHRRHPDPRVPARAARKPRRGSHGSPVRGAESRPTTRRPPSPCSASTTGRRCR